MSEAGKAAQQAAMQIAAGGSAGEFSVEPWPLSPRLGPRAHTPQTPRLNASALSTSMLCCLQGSSRCA